MTVHNRKDKTIQCLNLIQKQIIPDNSFKIDVFLTNDGCTDGTPEAVKASYPQVNIINGNGNLFWNRGMYVAWEEAAKHDYDFYLWLNDDTYLYQDAIMKLIEYAEETMNKSIIVGSLCSSDKLKATYGGLNKGKLITPNGELQECTTFVGNLVLIPSNIFKALGNMDKNFRHATGDLEYGYRAHKAGYKIYTSKDYLGEGDPNPILPAWQRKEVPLIKRLKNLYSPLGYTEPIPFFLYEKRIFGICTAIKHLISIHIRVLFPQLWKH